MMIPRTNQHDFVPNHYENNQEMWKDILEYIKVISKDYDILITKDCMGVIMIESVPSNKEYGDTRFVSVTPEEEENIWLRREYEDTENNEESSFCKTESEEIVVPDRSINMETYLNFEEVNKSDKTKSRAIEVSEYDPYWE